MSMIGDVDVDVFTPDDAMSVESASNVDRTHSTQMMMFSRLGIGAKIGAKEITSSLVLR